MSQGSHKLDLGVFVKLLKVFAIIVLLVTFFLINPLKSYADTTVTSDTFTRTTSNGWGTADTGGNYTTAGIASELSTNGSYGLMTVSATGSAGQDTARLDSVSAQDIDVIYRFTMNKIPTTSSGLAIAIGRHISSGNEYRGKVTITTAGAIYVQASKIVVGTESAFLSNTLISGLTFSANSFIYMHLQISGTNPTTIKMRAWADGNSEPGTWPYTTTDSESILQTKGSVGIISRAAPNVPVLYSYDNFTVTTSDAIPTPTPTPTTTPTPSPTPTPTYTLSGTVYIDTNQDGVQDNGESGYQNATVTLSGAGSASTTTNSSGNYSFSNLNSGVYLATITNPSNYGNTTSNPVYVAISSNTAQNFGIVNLGSPIGLRSFTATASAGLTNSFTMTPPAGIVSGDLLLAQITASRSATITATPSGWISIREDDSSASDKMADYYKIATGSEPSNYTWSFADNGYISGGIADYVGVDPVNPINTSSGRVNSNTNTVIFPSITTTAANTQLVLLVGIVGNTIVVSTPSGYLTRWEVNNAPGQFNTTGRTSSFMDSAYVGPGTPTANNATEGGSTAYTNITQIIALAPYVAPTNTPTPTPTISITPSPTPTPTPSDPTIEAAGDIVCQSLGVQTSTACRHMATSQILVDTNPTAVLPLGDTCHEPTAACFSNYYDPSWGRVKSKSKPILGNHEYLLDTTAAAYFDYFDGVGNSTGIGGTRGQGYYSYTIGSWHIIALNSQCGSVGGCQSGSAQETWLKNDLQNNPNKCTLAYWHIPLFSSGGRANANMLTIWNDLYAARADVVLNGHDHIYERFAPQGQATGVNSASTDSLGIRSFVVGTGGADHTTLVTNAPNSLVRNNNTFGVLKFTLHQSSYDWQFLPDTGSGNFTDSGTGQCNYAQLNSLTPTPTPTPTYTISGMVFNDLDNDGVLDPAEIGYQDATVTLSGAASTSATTDSSGSYSFSGLNAGSYTITLTTPAHYTSTSPNPVNINLTGSTVQGFAINTQSAPTISAISITPTTNGGTISWSTSATASSRLDYGLAQVTENSTAESDTSPFVTNHTITLSNLLSCTTYKYRVRSKDAERLEAISNSNTFTTTGCPASTQPLVSTTSQISATSGGTLSLLNGNTGLSLTIPSWFAASDSNFQIHQLDQGATLAVTSTPPNYSPIGNYTYQLEAISDDGNLSVSNSPLTITISYSAGDLSGINESTLTIYRWDGGSWTQLSNCSLDTSAKTVTCQTSNFSVFTLFGQLQSNSNSGNSSNNSSSGTSNNSGCSEAKPSSAPDLFEIDTAKTAASLYFAPAGNPNNKYYIAYGLNQNAEMYGVEFNQNYSSGAIKYNIDHLKPNTTYYFKVRGGNGCTAGDWGKIVAATTGSTRKFYPTQIIYRQNINNNSNSVPLKTQSSINTTAPKQNINAGLPSKTTASKPISVPGTVNKTNTGENPVSFLIKSITGFFGKLFK